MSKHMPGPWFIERFAHPYGRTEDRTISSKTKSGNMFRIGRAYNIAGPDETDANAHLIAAAPDMLAALKQIAGIYENADPRDQSAFGKTARMVDAAIAKAEGR